MTTPTTVSRKLPKKAKKKAPAKLTKKQIAAKLKKRKADAAAKAIRRKLYVREEMWTTNDELKFLDLLPDHMQSSLRFNGRPPTIIELFRHYTNYLAAAQARVQWGELDSVLIIAKAKALRQHYRLQCGR